MGKGGKYAAPKKHGKMAVILVIVFLLAAAAVAAVLLLRPAEEAQAPTTASTTVAPTETQPTETTAPPRVWETGFLASRELSVPVLDAHGAVLGALPRGTQVEFSPDDAGRTEIRTDDLCGYLPEEASLVAELTQTVPAHTQYVRTAVNLRDIDGRLLPGFAQKGDAVEVTGCDYLRADGEAHMYRVTHKGEEGYIMPWYLEENEDAALANYDNGHYETHAGRGDRYGGGGAGVLDYFPREKVPIEGNEMPSECRTLYMATWSIANVDAYLEVARDSGINAFVVDIADGTAIGYAAQVMQTYCPTSAANALNTVEEYRAAIDKLKAEGYYVIGRITTFNDSNFVKDHPEHAITNKEGTPMRLSGEYWPTPYNRTAWQYKVDLAVEAVELMGFQEIQFDYVRFPDRTNSYEKAGTIDFHDTYGETKAQAIQRFLMYASDILREHGAYISADVYGESAYTYVTGYGQYWPAISNVVDAISGMPYPDHFAASGDWLPWEHPYETLHNWGKHVMTRQGETATPAAVRTWIQCYNAIREPYNTYGSAEVAAQIKGLRDAGCTGGFMTWNSGADWGKYRRLLPAFAAPEGDEG